MSLDLLHPSTNQLTSPSSAQFSTALPTGKHEAVISAVTGREIVSTLAASTDNCVGVCVCLLCVLCHPPTPLPPLSIMALVGTQKITFSPHYGPTGSTYSSTPVTLTRFNQRRTSLDYNNDSDSTSKVRAHFFTVNHHCAALWCTPQPGSRSLPKLSFSPSIAVAIAIEMSTALC